MTIPSDPRTNLARGYDIRSVLTSVVEDAPIGILSSMTDLSSRTLRAVRPSTREQGDAILADVTRLMREPDALGLRRIPVSELQEGGGAPPHAIVAVSHYPGLRTPAGVIKLIGEALDLGPKGTIGYALVGSLMTALRRQARFEVRPFNMHAALRPERLDCDIPIWIGDEPSLGVECKNYRTQTLTRLTPYLRQKAERLTAAGIVPVTVCPWAAPRFRMDYQALGGITIEIEHYLLPSMLKAKRLAETLGTAWPVAAVEMPQTLTDGWGTPPPEVVERVLCGLGIAAQLQGESRGGRVLDSNSEDASYFSAAAKANHDDHQHDVHETRVQEVDDLFRSGKATNFTEAADILGLSERTVRRSFEATGRSVRRGRPPKNRTRGDLVSSYGGCETEATG